MCEEKKVNVQEIKDEELDLVAGGAYTLEEWKAMTTAERLAAQERSLRAHSKNLPCELD